MYSYARLEVTLVFTIASGQIHTQQLLTAGKQSRETPSYSLGTEINDVPFNYSEKVSI